MIQYLFGLPCISKPHVGVSPCVGGIADDHAAPIAPAVRCLYGMQQMDSGLFDVLVYLGKDELQSTSNGFYLNL